MSKTKGTRVYVQDKNGEALMPTMRNGHVRYLLKHHKAIVVNIEPFTIRLTYETEGITQAVHVGIDTGKGNGGISASSETGECLFSCNVVTNNRLIKKAMGNRADYRGNRRRYTRICKQRIAMNQPGRALKANPKDSRKSDEVWRHKKAVTGIAIRYPKAEEPVICKAIRGSEAQFANRVREEGWLPPSGIQLLQMHFCPANGK